MTQEAHTPEPRHVDSIGCHNDYRLRLCEPMRNGIPLATIAQFEFNWRDAGQYDRQISYREAEGNARRAAACVNALAGIPIEAIESGVVAELVAALKLWRDYDDCDEADFGSISPMLAYANAISSTRDALAKLEASK
mgnify:CR=1 FL=1